MIDFRTAKMITKWIKMDWEEKGGVYNDIKDGIDDKTREYYCGYFHGFRSIQCKIQNEVYDDLGEEKYKELKDES